jgi:hypothetical protein
MTAPVCEFEFWQSLDSRGKERWFWACATCVKTSKRGWAGYSTERDARMGMRDHGRDKALVRAARERSVEFYRLILTSEDWSEMESAIRVRLGRPDWSWLIDVPETDAEKIAAYREMFGWARKYIGGNGNG